MSIEKEEELNDAERTLHLDPGVQILQTPGDRVYPHYGQHKQNQ